MIYLSDNIADMLIPNVLGVTGVDAPRLAIINNVGRVEYETEIAFDSISPLYFAAMGMTFPDMPAGEYTYRLTDGETTLSEGLLIVGEYKTDREQYRKTMQYEQYGN